MQLVRDPDYEEIKACQDPAGDGFEAAFEALFERYRHRVYSIAYRITGSATDALDVTQESFSLVFRKVQGFRFDSLFSTWLFRLVVNCSIDHRRKERGRSTQAARTAALCDVAEPVDPAEGPEQAAESRELGDHVQAAIHALSPKLSAILVLRHLEGMSYEQLAVTLEISMGTVKSRLARAHLALERQLRGSLDPFGYPFDVDRGDDAGSSGDASRGQAAGGAA